MKATVIAPANIALVKYWGKRDKNLILPFQSSLSVTLDNSYTTTTVEFSPLYKEDVVIINGKEQTGQAYERTQKHIDLIRTMAGVHLKFKLQSTNSFPTKAGLASSASGGAAEAYAAATALGLRPTKKELSILARRSGSGSAARSIHEGFVLWHAGTKRDGSDSFAETLFESTHWEDFRILSVVVNNQEKEVVSSDAMDRTVATSPFYSGWVESSQKDIQKMKNAIKARDISSVGRIAEHNSFKLHGLMLSTDPALIYWKPETLEIIREIWKLREEGLELYATIDAGPNVKIICLHESEKKIIVHMKKIPCVKELISNGVGKGAYVTDKHLF